MKNKIPIKVSDEFYNFLKKFRVNRLKKDIDKEIKHFYVLPDIIVKYFKFNNDRYLELVHMEI